MTLARAIYSSAKTILLDDVSSDNMDVPPRTDAPFAGPCSACKNNRALEMAKYVSLCIQDVHTSRWIVNKCFKGDLVRSRTVILVVGIVLNVEFHLVNMPSDP